MLQLLLWIVPLALLIFALVDLITSDNWQVKHLPKITWVFIIIFLPFVGSIIWLVVGKDRGHSTEHVSFGDPRRHQETVERMRTEAEELAEIEREIERVERDSRIRRLEAQIAERKREKN